MSALARTDTSILGRWWWTVDRWTLLAVGLLIATGSLLAFAASPAVADRIGLESFHFVERHLLFLVPVIAMMFGISLLSPKGVRRLAVVGFVISLSLVALTLFAGEEVKGARRWLYIGGWSLHPSEFAKPTFAVVTAWLFALTKIDYRFPGRLVSAVLFALLLGLLLSQPDVGMAVMVTSVWLAQFFLAGLPMLWVGFMLLVGLAGAIGAYMMFPHVAQRVDLFLNPASGDSYQVDRAMEAIATGGLMGQGPGEGVVKNIIPDAHTDFIFAVAAEEFGLLACAGIVALFGFIVLRGFARIMRESDYFVVLASAGLLIQFGLQAVINIGVNLNLLPTKGLTLPFISYGGSSMLALALGMGMVLALTRHRAGAGLAS